MFEDDDDFDDEDFDPKKPVVSLSRSGLMTCPLIAKPTNFLT
jgi:hypothetical protein